MSTDVDIRSAFRERVLSGIYGARSGRGWVLFLLNELTAARRLRYKWAWIHAKLVELDIQISLRNLRDIYASVKERSDDEEVGKLVAMAGGPMTLLPKPASPSARPKTSGIEEKTAAADAAAGPLAGAQPPGDSVKKPDESGGEPNYLSFANSPPKFGNDVIGIEQSKRKEV